MPDSHTTAPDTNLVRACLEAVARDQTTIDYKTLAERLSFRSPGMIRKTTTLLEAIQEEDALLKQPQLAAVVIQKSGKPYPRPGFFQTLKELDLYAGKDDGADAQMWHQNELEKVYATYRRTTR
ncbi:hypothetical protein [Reinekea blandensis]|uniref:Uncharacterized protein n=1 Tax=Reinekea blandensis MED297 TaxID=314283 RepID=A4BFF2_9GAMM|nr:hypothetical protein [Reinekea blandensis]EAR09047.1 hypothetical protein MED297_16933 [Reinekea sp. MED297] [Reinekea blandensis MED297]